MIRQNLTHLICAICLTVGLSTPLLAQTELFEFNVSDTTLKQGDTLKLDISSKKLVVNHDIEFYDNAFQLFRVATSDETVFAYQSYLGVPRDGKLGKQPIDIALTLSDGQSYYKTLYINVVDGKFPSHSIKVPAAKKKVANDLEQLQRENELMQELFERQTRIQYFKTPFIQPVKGIITSPFGAARVYTSNHKSRYHSGVDIANELNTPVVSANDGIVLLSADLTSHGGTVLVDHGHGIMTVYNHLQERLVKEGDFVRQGQALGKLGSTGISTGPHLHWGMSVQGVRVNPLAWLENEKLYN